MKTKAKVWANAPAAPQRGAAAEAGPDPDPGPGTWSGTLILGSPVIWELIMILFSALFHWVPKGFLLDSEAF